MSRIDGGLRPTHNHPTSAHAAHASNRFSSRAKKCTSGVTGLSASRRPMFGEQQRFVLLLIAPAALLMLLFQVVPIVIGANASFRDWALYNPKKIWVGLAHYHAVITDPAFLYVVLPNTFLFMVVSVAGALGDRLGAGAAAQPPLPRPEARADHPAGAADGGAGHCRDHDPLDLQRPVRHRECGAGSDRHRRPALAGAALERVCHHRADRHLAVDAVVHAAVARGPAEPAEGAVRGRRDRRHHRPGACSAISRCRCCAR